MYTSGIRKVFTCLDISLELDDVADLAVKAGYHALNYNGDIYIRLTKECWIQSPFRVSDFACGGWSF